MNSLASRVVLVGLACVLVGTGVFASASAVGTAGRVVAIAAGLCCALLDRAVTAGQPVTSAAPPASESAPRGEATTAPIRMAQPTGGPAPIVLGRHEGRPHEGRRHEGRRHEGRRHEGGQPEGTRDDDRWVDGDAIVTRARRVVVVGHGPLAAAVFAAAVSQMTSDPGVDPTRTRRSTDGPTPLPPGHDVVACADATGRPFRSVVLVPDLGSLPRRHQVVVEVTRYGCTVSGSVDGAGDGTRVGRAALDPSLPRLDPPVPVDEQDDPERSGLRRRSAVRISAARLRRGPHRRGRRRPVPVRPSPP